ncbi:MAG: 3-dehydroquinate synthase [Clostridiaceae bacterium]|jgi:3-dehydroquinate synthase|nr:3-dehydroquinate synthase [Clostridiaceae bacterium]
MNNEIITVRVNASTSYDVTIGRGILQYVGKYIADLGNIDKVAIVTDDLVDALYSDTVEKSLRECGLKTVKSVFKNGEKSKTLSTVGKITDDLAKAELTRSDLVLALGGGVVGDMAGFAAGIYMRGIRYAQVPTTLLAIIDSSVGGKTGVNLRTGKNLAGLFNQPELVFADTDTLKTLPEEQMLNGIGEGIKYAVLDGGELFDIMEAGLDDGNTVRFAELCVSYKRDVVEADERESGIRRLLNLGHTVGHAIEKLSRYTVSHGFAVASGLKVISEACVRRGLLDAGECARITALLDKYGLGADAGYPVSALIREMPHDKKRVGAKISLVIVNAIGKCAYISVETARLKEFFS